MGANNYFNQLADVTTGAIGLTPTYATPAALGDHADAARHPRLLARALERRRSRRSLLSDTGTLHWVQVDGTGSGTLARTRRQRNKATEPAWSHDGNTVVYVSGKTIVDGRLDTGPADLYAVPYQNRAGGAAKPLPGASDPGFTEYYPSFSPDDALRGLHPRSAGRSRRTATPTRRSTSCRSAAAPAARRSAWRPTTRPPVRPRSPAPASPTTGRSGLRRPSPPTARPTTGSRSHRSAPGRPTPSSTSPRVVVDEVGKVTTYPALYLWNQPSTDGNHTPSWDDFAIPPIS